MERGTGPVLLAAALLLTGCLPKSYGISSAGNLSPAPDHGCVADALRATPGVSEVEIQSSSNSGIEILPRPGRTTTFVGWITYRFGDYAPASLNLVTTRDSTRYLHRIDRRQPVPAAETAAFRPVMTAVNANVAARCGVRIDGIRISG